MQSPIYERATDRFSFAARPSKPTFFPVPVNSEPLSDRELEVLKHVAEGLSNKEIASELAISTHTVARHVTNIMRKLDAANRAQAFHSALRASQDGS